MNYKVREDKMKQKTKKSYNPLGRQSYEQWSIGEYIGLNVINFETNKDYLVKQLEEFAGNNPMYGIRLKEEAYYLIFEVVNTSIPDSFNNNVLVKIKKDKFDSLRKTEIDKVLLDVVKAHGTIAREYQEYIEGVK